MSQINLLPVDLVKESRITKNSDALKKATLFAAAIFLIIVSLGVGSIIFLNDKIQSVNTDNSALRQKVQALEASEQQLFLVKDRLDKINNIFQAGAPVTKSFDTFNQLVTNLPANVSLTQAGLTSITTSFTVLSKDSLSAATFLNNLVINRIYKNLTLTDFTFSPDVGYKISLNSTNE